jgi:hypothetical protein
MDTAMVKSGITGHVWKLEEIANLFGALASNHARAKLISLCAFPERLLFLKIS